MFQRTVRSRRGRGGPSCRGARLPGAGRSISFRHRYSLRLHCVEFRVRQGEGTHRGGDLCDFGFSVSWERVPVSDDDAGDVRREQERTEQWPPGGGRARGRPGAGRGARRGARRWVLTAGPGLMGRTARGLAAASRGRPLSSSSPGPHRAGRSVTANLSLRADRALPAAGHRAAPLSAAAPERSSCWPSCWPGSPLALLVILSPGCKNSMK